MMPQAIESLILWNCLWAIEFKSLFTILFGEEAKRHMEERQRRKISTGRISFLLQPEEWSFEDIFFPSPLENTKSLKNTKVIYGEFEDFKSDQGRDRIIRGGNTQALLGSIWTRLQDWEYFLARDVLETIRQGYPPPRRGIGYGKSQGRKGNLGGAYVSTNENV